MGNNPGWWHCLVISSRKKPPKTNKNSHIPETARQESSWRTQIPPDPSRGAFTAKPLVQCNSSYSPAPSLETKGFPLGRKIPPGRRNLGWKPAPAPTGSAPRVQEHPAKARGREEQKHHSHHLQCCGTEKSLVGIRARPWDKADPWSKS